MAVVTYLPRALPLILVRQQMHSPFIRSFLYYMPYAVLGAMTFPALLYATSSPVSAVLGMAAALMASFLDAQLLPVALISTAVVFFSEELLGLF